MSSRYDFSFVINHFDIVVSLQELFNRKNEREPHVSPYGGVGLYIRRSEVEPQPRSPPLESRISSMDG